MFGLRMIKGYTCVQCLRLFHSLPKGDETAIHKCTPDVIGMFVEAPSDCTSFQQYVIRYALGPIKQPGSPSNCGSSSSGKIKSPGTSSKTPISQHATPSNSGSNVHSSSNAVRQSPTPTNGTPTKHPTTPTCCTPTLLGPSSSKTSLPANWNTVNPQPTEGGVYLPPNSPSNSSCSSRTNSQFDTLSSMHSVNGLFHPIEFRKSGPVKASRYHDSDTQLARSASSSALLAKAKDSHTVFSDSSNFLNRDCLGESSMTPDSNNNDQSIPPTESSSICSSASSSTSWVTAASRLGKRGFTSDSEDSGSRIKRQRCLGNANSGSSIDHVEITSSMENLSVVMVNTPMDWKASKNKRRKKKKRNQMQWTPTGSDSSHSNDSWTKVNQGAQNNGVGQAPSGGGALFSPRKKQKAVNHGNSQDNKQGYRKDNKQGNRQDNQPGPSGTTSLEDMELARLFSCDGRSPGHSIMITDSPLPTGCQTSGSLSMILPPTKGIQTSSSLVGANTEAPSIGLLSPAPNIPEGLDTMRQIVFLDVDNWGNFWRRLPQRLPDRTFVWGFYGGATSWKEPCNEPFQYAKQNGLWHLHKKCSNRKDAADFAICLMVGKLDERLPKHIPFTILSGDRGFLELEEQMRGSRRRATVINPHHRSQDEVYILICSVGRHRAS